MSAEFEILQARSGFPTARHIPSGMLIHSAVDPVAEAEEHARAEVNTALPATILIGGGLGYLCEAILRRQPAAGLYVVEPHPELCALARRARSKGKTELPANVHWLPAATTSALRRRLETIPTDAQVVISPYLPRIAQGRDGLSRLLQVFRAERASREIYSELLERYLPQNALILGRLPRGDSLTLKPAALYVIAAAGPGLMQGLDFLRTHRADVCIVAVSGAVPVLLNAGILPDWTVALEGREAILTDLADLPAGSRVIIFPATHPQIVANENWQRFAGQNGAGDGLAARGGSSAIPALDFVLRAASGDVLLLGLDLGNQHGAYAAGVKRENNDTATIPVPPKFGAMRAGLEWVIAAHRGSSQPAARTIFHRIERGRQLSGTTALEAVQGWNCVLSTTENQPC